MLLLSEAASNAKTAKNDATNYLSYILHLAPYTLSGVNLCPKASQGCAAACLNSAGRGAFSNVQAARLRKSLLFVKQRDLFFEQLVADLEKVVKKAAKQNKTAVVRLNGTSDIVFEAMKVLNTGKNIFELFPTIQFYDYTKILSRLKRLKTSPINNYYLLFSRSESNEVEALEALKLGYNVAVVFESVPPTYLGAQTIDGDSTDLRFLEPSLGHVVALKAKGKAKRDAS
jgi:hypothetical protein